MWVGTLKFLLSGTLFGSSPMFSFFILVYAYEIFSFNSHFTPPSPNSVLVASMNDLVCILPADFLRVYFAHLSVPCSVLHNVLHSVAAKLMFTKTLAPPLDAGNSRFEFQLYYILFYDLGQVGNLSEPQLHGKVLITHIWQTWELHVEMHITRGARHLGPGGHFANSSSADVAINVNIQMLVNVVGH